MLVQGQSVNGFASFYLLVLICQGSKNLKYLNTIVGILVKSDDTEGFCKCYHQHSHPHHLVQSKSVLIIVIMSWHAVQDSLHKCLQAADGFQGRRAASVYAGTPKLLEQTLCLRHPHVKRKTAIRHLFVSLFSA